MEIKEPADRERDELQLEQEQLPPVQTRKRYNPRLVFNDPDEFFFLLLEQSEQG